MSKSASAALESSFAASSDLVFTSTMTSAADMSSYSTLALTGIGNSFPVWFDTLNSAPFGTIPLSSALPIAHHIQYAPAMSEAGAASVLLCTFWLISGYFTGAFKFKNTLECTTDKALIVTAQTWFITCLFMFAVAFGSDWVVGNFVDCLHKSVGLTVADEDYILDSLSVLLMWRFTVSSFFGYGGGGSSSDDK